MAHQINTLEASIYVGTYGKYNAGSFFGKWLNLSDYSDKDEFYTACRELHKDERDPEFMFQDYENIPEDLISESWISDKIFDVLEALDDMEESRKEPFLIWCNNRSHSFADEDIYDLIRGFENDYVGKYEDEEDYAYNYVEQFHDLPNFALHYFDYKRFARDLFMGYFWFEDGYVFYSN